MAEKIPRQTDAQSASSDSEKIFTIPLREAYKKSERKRSPYAVRYVKNYLIRHTKASEVKLGSELNKAVWARGMRKPLASVRVKAVRDGDVVKAELVGYEFKEFKAKPRTEKKGAKERLMERLGPKAIQKEKEEKMIEGKEEKPEEAKEEKKQPA